MKPTLDLSNKLIDIVEVIGLAVVGDGELPVRGLSSTVTIG